MASSRWLQLLHFLRLEFWLSIPLLGAAFWFVTAQMTNQVLSRPYETVVKLQAAPQLKVNPANTVIIVKVEVQKHQKLTKVEVETSGTESKKLDFEFPVTDLNQVEALLAQELGLSREEFRQLARYQIKNT